MNNIPPILILAVIWLLIGLPLSRLNKAKQQQAGTAAKKAPQASPQEQAQPKSAPAPEPPAREKVLQPTITFTEHDDSVYQGSMGAVTGEGYDPCHDEQMASLSSAETAVPAEEAAVSGLQLSWTGNDVVRGFVMGEILNRKRA